MADDHPLFREGLRKILEAQTDMQVVGEADEVVAVPDLVRLTRPDVVLLDVGVPGADVPELVGQIADIAPGIGVVVLSMSDDPDFVRALARRHVRGFLHKSTSRHELVAVVRAASRPGHVTVSISADGADRLFAPPGEVIRVQRLSQREAEVLGLAAQALSNVQIAGRLGTTEGTVKRHLRNVFGKLGAVSRIDAINRGIAAGIVPAPYAGRPGPLDSPVVR
nr:response regulator transcription factor [Kineosporia mesophila]